MLYKNINFNEKKLF